MLQPYMAEIVGQGSWFDSLKKFIRRASHGGKPALLLGEPGTGKELVARLIHFGSRRKNYPFIAVDCSLYYERELERELFGVAGLHSKSGARKGLLEIASRGTCYISSAEEMAPALQQRVFNYLDTGYLQQVGSDRPISSRVRLVFSSGKDLAGFSDGGLFSRQLFESFSHLMLEIPPLRSRPHDIVPFVRQVAATYRLEQPSAGRVEFSPRALEALKVYPWPGNYDELKGELLRLFRTGGRLVSPELLSPEITQYWLGQRGAPKVRKVIEEIEAYIQEFRIMIRLDAEYGDILLDTEDWDLHLKCYDRMV